MSVSLYDASVSTYLQVTRSVDTILAKGAEYAQENELDLAELVNTRLRPDMNPFSFQVNSVRHHSMGCVEGLRRGELGPPPALESSDYTSLQKLVSEAITDLEAVSAEEINAMEGQPMKFKMGDFEIPFTAEGFVLSFSLPNFYFHATTTYDMLRIVGVPLGKMDFLGQMKIAG